MRMNKKEIVPKLRFPEFVNEDKWKNKRIEQLLTIGNGCDYKHLSKGDIPVYGSGGYMCSVDDFLYDGDSVCIGRKGTIEKPIFLRGKFWAVDTLFYTHSYKNCIPKFIYNIFQRINWLKYNEAGGVPSLSKTTINKINIYIPKIPEQQKIADCLSSIDELIDAESRKLKALEKYKKGLMQKLFPAEGKTMPEWRFPEFQGCGEWKYEEIGNIGKVITGKTPSTSDAALWDGDIQFVTPTDITENKYQHHTQRTVVKTPKMKVLPKHTIMFTCIASIGKMALSLYPCITNQQINSIVPKSCYNNEFIYYSLLQKTFLIKAGFANSILPIINKTDFSKIQVPVILDKKEQQKIAECLSEADTMIEEQSNKVEQLKAHKKGLMQGLFPSLEEADV